MNSTRSDGNTIEIDNLRSILARCPEYEEGHHLGRPFMSSYQIAIRFAAEHPGHPAVRLGIGGRDHGEPDSLTKCIAARLSGHVRRHPYGDIEGGFISHRDVTEFTFVSRAGGHESTIRVSTLESQKGHTVFRLRDIRADRRD